ncbi:MAG: hypothetical protein KGL39_08720 [Patescibacteria group bacterium]|nr:hypothetical protein [Patescibacteria group bacterium]
MSAKTNRNQYQGLFTQDITAKVSVTIPSVLTNAGTSATATITGAAIGDEVHVIPQVSVAGLLLSAYVSAANTVTIVARNDSGSTVNLGAQTFYIRVSRPNSGLYT